MTQETKQCQSCKKDFTIEPEDFVFYDKMKVPPPTWCPECRLMRRLLWRNERSLYARPCSLCKENIIAMFPDGSPFPVYCSDCWYSDKWGATEYGRDYDFSRSFFSQFYDLLQVVPQIALQSTSSPDSRYVNLVANCQKCYLIADAIENEECMYSVRIFNSKNTVDSSFVRHVEYCYECKNADKLTNSSFSDDCYDSTHLAFCSDVRGSADCFMSSNLRRASYVFRNHQLSRDEYQKEIASIDMGSYLNLQAYKEEYEVLRKKRLYPFMVEKNTESCTGHSIINANDCKHCFYCSNVDSSKYLFKVADLKDCYDLNSSCCTAERAYELSSSGLGLYNVMLSADVWPDVRDTAYSQSCRNDVNNLFGCVSLRKKQYCILNKQYSPEEYHNLMEKIIAHMDEVPYVDKNARIFTYGEFFPPELSIFAYNESAAQDYFPRTRREIESLGFLWREAEKKDPKVTIEAGALPDHIRETPDSITKEIIRCEHAGTCDDQCTRAFRIIPQELKVYRERNIALPRLCPSCRHYKRFSYTNPYRLWSRQCRCGGGKSTNGLYMNGTMHSHGDSPCGATFETSYAPDRQEIVYCESCYQNEVV